MRGLKLLHHRLMGHIGGGMGNRVRVVMRVLGGGCWRRWQVIVIGYCRLDGGGSRKLLDGNGLLHRKGGLWCKGLLQWLHLHLLLLLLLLVALDGH